MLFDRILLTDHGSLSSQSYRAAIANDKEAKAATILSDVAKNNAIFIYFQTLNNMSATHGSPIVCHDKYPIRKLNLFADYKKKRFERYTKTYTNDEAGTSEVPEGEELSIHQQFRRELANVTKHLPQIDASADGEEADDVIATALYDITNVHVRVFTRDTDLYQLVGIKTGFQLLYKSPVSKDLIAINETIVHDKYGVRPDQVVLYKALLGDDGDGIPKVKKIHGKICLSRIIQDRTTVQEVHDAWHSGFIDTTKWHKNWDIYLNDHLEQAFINEKLARLKTDVAIKYTYQQGNFDQFKEMYDIAAGPRISRLPAITIWNAWCTSATIILDTLQKDNIFVSTLG